VLERDREPYQPQRVFSPEQALEAMTLGTAYATGRDAELGRIAPGYRANVVVFAANPLAEAPEALLDTASRLTLVDGEIAFGQTEQRTP